MQNPPVCSTCENLDLNCSVGQVAKCLNISECEYCDGTTYGYPYGLNESRHCKTCGAEWSVWK